MPIIDKKLPNGKTVKWDTETRGAVAEFPAPEPETKAPKKATKPKAELTS